jgi:pantoate kinase
MSTVKIYCPLALSLIFKICPNKNINRMGSIGVGFTVDKGVSVSVEQSETQNILFNGENIIFPTIVTAIQNLTQDKINVKIVSRFPLGYGFGISGASALSVAHGLNKLLGLKLPLVKLAQIAHKAEILNKTGLGTVGTLYTGGFLIKEKPGIPVIAKKLPFTGTKIYATLISKLETPKVLNNRKMLEEINQAADKAFFQINKYKSLTLSEILDISYSYSRKSQIISKDVQSVINTIQKNGGSATMAILGNVVISNMKPPGNLKYPVEELVITKDRIRLLS